MPKFFKTKKIYDVGHIVSGNEKKLISFKNRVQALDFIELQLILSDKEFYLKNTKTKQFEYFDKSTLKCLVLNKYT